MDLTGVDASNWQTAIQQLQSSMQLQIAQIQQQLTDERNNWASERAQLMEERQRLIDERQTLLSENQQFRLDGRNAGGQLSSGAKRDFNLSASADSMGPVKRFKFGPGKTSSINDESVVANTSGAAINAEVNELIVTNDVSQNLSSVGNADDRADAAWSTVTSKTQRKTDRLNGSNKTTPIQLQSLEMDRLRTLGADLAKLTGRNEIFVQRLTDGKQPRIICGSEKAKQIATDYLKNNDIQFNSYNNADTRLKSFIVRGMLGETDADAISMISAAVRDVGVQTEFEVSRFITPYQRHHPLSNRSPLYRITVPGAVADQLLLDIRTIGYCGVRLERMKKSAVVQCRNCQRLHHTTNQCSFRYRCVQCATAHEYGQCPRATNRALPIGCINCLDAKLPHNEHTANDLRNCNFYKQIVEKQQRQQQQRQQNATQRRQPGTGGPRLSEAAANVGHSVSVKPRNFTDSLPPSSGAASYADAVRGGISGITAEQLAKIVTVTVQSVLTALAHGS